MSPAKAQPAPGVVSLAAFNAMPAPDAHRLLLACCPAERWAGQVAAGRPFSAVSAALLRSDAAVASLAQADLEQALSGHPRIGQGQAGAQARAEQAGVDHADQELILALADGNRAYERRFGHIYLVCATGRTGPELLALLRERLGNSPASEWRVLAAELAKINRVRLARLVRESG
jgi:2-oxo-4-hydroxy-4-carboxy-5-ureidoimidazoline decarboxylase